MELDKKEWRSFKFTDIFTIKGGFYNKKPSEDPDGTIPFLGATDSNNGITQFNTLDNITSTSKTGDDNNAPLEQKIFDGNCIVVTNNGSVGYAYYQKHRFTCSHDVNPLYLKNAKLNEDLARFLISAIEKQRVCFTYVHKWRPKRMRKSSILLPVDDKNNPDYVFMENYTKQIRKDKTDTYISYCKEQLRLLGKVKPIPKLDKKKWEDFFIIDIFGKDNIQRGKRLTRNNQTSGTVPYVSSTAFNNGVDNFIEVNSKMRVFNNCLSIANSGSVGSSFYEPFEFVASDHVTHLKNDSFNKYIYLFIAAMTSRWSEKYNFNREISDTRIEREKINLPVDKSGNPDYKYMEQYIKNMMIKKYKTYLSYADKRVSK